MIKLFTDPNHPRFLGYRGLGRQDWSSAADAVQVNLANLTSFFRNRQQYQQSLIDAAVNQLFAPSEPENASRTWRTRLLNGFRVRPGGVGPEKHVYCINWHVPESNDFGVIELTNHLSKNSLVLIVNGIPIALVDDEEARAKVQDVTSTLLLLIQCASKGGESCVVQYGPVDAQSSELSRRDAFQSGSVCQPSGQQRLLSQLCEKKQLLSVISSGYSHRSSSV